MDVLQIGTALAQAPFKPTRLWTTDGKSVPIARQEFAAISIADDGVMVLKEKGGWTWVDAAQVARVEVVTDPEQQAKLREESKEFQV